MKRRVCVMVIVLLSAAGQVMAGGEKPEITVSSTYVSRYIDDGFDAFSNNHSGILNTVNVDFRNGFGLGVGWVRANGSGFENSEKLSYEITYTNSLFGQTCCGIEYEIGFGYNHFPDEPGKAADTQECFATLMFAELLKGVRPYYTAKVEWPSEGDSDVRKDGGWLHGLGLGYDISLPHRHDIFQGRNICHICAEIYYNDGIGGTDVDHDWSHALFGLSTELKINDSIALSPGVFHQISMDDSVNRENETFFSMAASFRF